MRKGISAIIATIILLMITIALSGTAYLYISYMMGSRMTTTIELVDAFCKTGTTYNNITVIVRNAGTDTIDTGLTIVVNGVTATPWDPTCDNSIDPGTAATCIVNGTDGVNQVRVIGPVNAVGGPVVCG